VQRRMGEVALELHSMELAQSKMDALSDFAARRASGS